MIPGSGGTLTWDTSQYYDLFNPTLFSIPNFRNSTHIYFAYIFCASKN